MRSVFWNRTTVEDETPGSTFKLQGLRQRTSAKALWVPAGVMWQSEAPLNPGRHPQRLTTKAQITLPWSQKTNPRVQAPAFWL
jgi:hypothetical protein